MLKQSWTHSLALLIVFVASVHGQDKRTFSLPDAVLLFGTYADLRLVTSDSVLEIKPPIEVGFNHGYFVYPALSPRSDLIAWGYAVEYQKNRPSYSARLALGVYSLKEQKWKTYGEFDEVGTPAFSRDGAKIAFVALKPVEGYHLLIFDVKAGSMTATNVNAKGNSGEGEQGIPEKATLGWAPDGKRLVVELRGNDKPSSIAVIDTGTGEVRRIGEGSNPSWSPTGEWIAHYDTSGKKCLLVHPDGSGIRIVSESRSSFRTVRNYGYAVVWSPDGRKLLLNELRGPYRAIDVSLLDLATGRLIPKTKNGLPVFGWEAFGK